MADRMHSREEWEKEQRRKWEEERRIKDAQRAVDARHKVIRSNLWNVAVGPGRITLHIPSNTRPQVLEEQLEQFKKNIGKWCFENRVKPLEIWVSITGGEPYKL